MKYVPGASTDTITYTQPVDAMAASKKMCMFCLVAWYRHNYSGYVINTATLGCPFCRQYPTLPLVAKYGLGIYVVKDVTKALRDKGKFIMHGVVNVILLRW